MKKIIIIVLSTFLIFTVTACGCKKQEAAIQTPEVVEVEDKTIEEQVKNETKDEQDDITFSDIKISEYGASNIVTGKVKNNRSNIRNIKLTLKMYNSQTSKMLGKVSVDIKNLQAHEERTFEIKIMGDYTTVDNFKVEVSEL